MKNLVILIAALVLTAPVFAGDSFDDIFKRYSGQEDITAVNIGESIVKIASGFMGEDKETQELLKAIKSVRVLVSDGKVNANLSRDARKLVDESDMEELIRVNDGDELVRILVSESGNIIKEVLILADSAGELALINIVGDIDPEKVGKVLKSLDIDVDVDIEGDAH